MNLKETGEKFFEEIEKYLPKIIDSTIESEKQKLITLKKDLKQKLERIQTVIFLFFDNFSLTLLKIMKNLYN